MEITTQKQGSRLVFMKGDTVIDARHAERKRSKLGIQISSRFASIFGFAVKFQLNSEKTVYLNKNSLKKFSAALVVAEGQPASTSKKSANNLSEKLADRVNNFIREHDPDKLSQSRSELKKRQNELSEMRDAAKATFDANQRKANTRQPKFTPITLNPKETNASQSLVDAAAKYNKQLREITARLQASKMAADREKVSSAFKRGGQKIADTATQAVDNLKNLFYSWNNCKDKVKKKANSEALKATARVLRNHGDSVVAVAKFLAPSQAAANLASTAAQVAGEYFTDAAGQVYQSVEHHSNEIYDAVDNTIDRVIDARKAYKERQERSAKKNAKNHSSLKGDVSAELSQASSEVLNQIRLIELEQEREMQALNASIRRCPFPVLETKNLLSRSSSVTSLTSRDSGCFE